MDGLMLAKPWEVLTCSAGHPIYIAKRNIMFGTVLNDEQYIRLTDYTTMAFFRCGCPKCDAPIWHLLDGTSNVGIYVRGELRLPQGWRSLKQTASGKEQ